jgi:hypothetical protein
MTCVIICFLLLPWTLFGLIEIFFCYMLVLSFMCFLTKCQKWVVVEWIIFISIALYIEITSLDALVHLKY